MPNTILRSSELPTREANVNPVARLMVLRDQGANADMLFATINETFAVTKYGGQTMIANIINNDITFMKVEDFNRMFANLVVLEIHDDRTSQIKVSKRWFDWPGRRQYLGRGVVFEPGGPPEIPNDMLNLWRGFGVEPRPGNWSLMRSHILEVICSGNQEYCDYLIKWMAYAVQHLDQPIGVAVALVGAQGAGKGVVARTFGKFFGKHFAHIANGDQITGRFNASVGQSCAVFLDEALWAGDKRSEGVLKALITEPKLQLEAKFRDPIMVDNRLRIMVASNEDWVIPAGVGDRRWFVLNVADTYAGGYQEYWDALYAEVENGGAAAMLNDLLAIDLSGFNVRAAPHTVARGQQQMLSLHGTEAWLCHVLQEGAIGCYRWQNGSLVVTTDHAYMCYEDFSKRQHAWRPEIKAEWSKKVRRVLRARVKDIRPKEGRSFEFAPLSDCRCQFATYVGTQIEWEPEDAAPIQSAVPQTADDVGQATDFVDDLINRLQEGRALEPENT
jgi:hypothetical protein